MILEPSFHGGHIDIFEVGIADEFRTLCEQFLSFAVETTTFLNFSQILNCLKFCK